MMAPRLITLGGGVTSSRKFVKTAIRPDFVTPSLFSPVSLRLLEPKPSSSAKQSSFSHDLEQTSSPRMSRDAVMEVSRHMLG
jgi:hypothetical protein